MVKFAVPVMALLITGIPFVGALAPLLMTEAFGLRILFLFLAPSTFTLFYVLVTGVFSLPFHSSIKKGKFPRDLAHPVYGPRRLYGLCWTFIYYFSPLYHLCLSIPLLKRFLFGLFGYKGASNFIVYPDTWIRDLPILNVGEGAYLSNKATMGTNMCLKSGHIMVDSITVGKGALIGHLALIAPGVIVMDDAEVGVATAVGIRTRLQEKVKIAPECFINHGVDLGAGVEVGGRSYIGIRAVIREGIRVPAGANIPAGAIINTQDEMDKYLSSETSILEEVRAKLKNLFLKGKEEGSQVTLHEDIKTIS